MLIRSPVVGIQRRRSLFSVCSRVFYLFLGPIINHCITVVRTKDLRVCSAHFHSLLKMSLKRDLIRIALLLLPGFSRLSSIIFPHHHFITARVLPSDTSDETRYRIAIIIAYVIVNRKLYRSVRV